MQKLRWLGDAVTRHFDVDAAVECAIEIDPRVTTGDQLATLHQIGFNRLSMGVQDLEAEVQAAIGRHQSENQSGYGRRSEKNRAGNARAEKDTGDDPCDEHD